MKIPIERSNADPFYRYQMDEVKVKIEGRGNGIKTIITNLTAISHALKRNPEHILRFLGYELGSQTKSEKSENRYTINGAHEVGCMQSQIYDFIDKYVMCTQCKNPETFYVLKDGKTLHRECYACGYKSKTEGRLANLIAKDVDSTQRTESYHSQSESMDSLAAKDNAPVANRSRAADDASPFSTDLAADIARMKTENYKTDAILPALEIYVAGCEDEDGICKFLDALVQEGLLKRSDIFKYFQSKSRVVDRRSSSKIRLALRSYFD